MRRARRAGCGRLRFVGVALPGDAATAIGWLAAVVGAGATGGANPCGVLISGSFIGFMVRPLVVITLL